MTQVLESIGKMVTDYSTISGDISKRYHEVTKIMNKMKNDPKDPQGLEELKTINKTIPEQYQINYEPILSAYGTLNDFIKSADLESQTFADDLKNQQDAIKLMLTNGKYPFTMGCRNWRYQREDPSSS